MATVIDSLIVTLGLDPTDFTKGQKTAAKSLLETEKKTKTASTEMGKAITSAARQFAVAFLGFQSAQGFVRMLSGLHRMTRELGFIGLNTENSTARLRNWSNAAEVASGAGQGMLGTIEQIQAEQSNFLLTGQSGWSGYLNALGEAGGKVIPLIDGLGRARNELDVLMDLTEAFDRIKNTQGRAQANQIGLGMGIDQGVMNFLLKGPAAVRSMLKDQESSMFQISEGMTQSADRLSQRFTLMKQHGESWLLALLEKLEPILNKWADALEKWMGSIDLNYISGQIDRLINALVTVGGWLARFTSWAISKFPLASTAPAARQAAGGAFSQTLFERAGIFGGYKHKTIAELADQLGLQNDETELGAWIGAMMNATGKKQDEQLTDDDRQRLRKVYAEMLNIAQTSATAAPGLGTTNGAAFAAASSGTVYNQTQIDSISVVVPNGDANAIAAEIGQALRRKGLVANADSGLA